MHLKLNVQSSANKMDENLSEILGNSLITIRKHKQDKFEPWGMPTVKGREEEISFIILTDCVLSAKKLSSNFRKIPFIPYNSNFFKFIL